MYEGLNNLLGTAGVPRNAAVYAAIKEYFYNNRNSIRYVILPISEDIRRGSGERFKVYSIEWGQTNYDTTNIGLEPKFQQVDISKNTEARAFLENSGINVGGVLPNKNPQTSHGYPWVQLEKETITRHRNPANPSDQSTETNPQQPSNAEPPKQPLNLGKCWDLFEPNGSLKDNVKQIIENDWLTQIKPAWFGNPQQDPAFLIKKLYGNNQYKIELIYLCSTCKKALFSKDPKYSSYQYGSPAPTTNNLPFENNVQEMQNLHRFMLKLNNRLKEIATKSKTQGDTWKDWSKEPQGTENPQGDTKPKP